MTASPTRAPVITIDGPAGAGKGTVARLLAGRLGYRLIDTGAMYRAVAVSVKRAGVALDDADALERHLRNTEVAVVDGRVFLDGRDVTSEIRSQEIGQLTSRISAFAPVREKVTPLQRQEAAEGGVVLEGRDTGTVVCPEAEVKFFLTASLDARARRRHAELAAQGIPLSLEAVRAEVAARDAQDEGRALAPLRKAPDAIEVDTTELTIEQAVDSMLGAIARRAVLPGRRAAVPTRREPGRPFGDRVDPAKNENPRAQRGEPDVLYAIMKSLTMAVMRILFRIKRRGGEGLPARGPLLLVANHSSVLDSPLVGCLASRPLSFLAKADLFRIPIFGWLIARLNARPLRREGSDPAALRTALKILEENQALLIFPEGTRGDEGILRSPKPGAGMLAVLSGAPVVPVLIQGSGRAWPRGRRFPRPGKVVVTFGTPLRFERRDDVDRKQQYEAASRAMMAAIARLRDTGDAGQGSEPSRSPSPSPSDVRQFEVVGGPGGNARDSSKSTYGRKRQHE